MEATQREVVRIALIAGDEGAIIERAFVGVEIRGPAILGLDDKTTVTNCYIEWGDDRESVLWEIPNDKALFFGLIAVLGCTFTDCRFRNVGFAGKELFIRNFRRDVMV
jgi:hypothetical protein